MGRIDQPPLTATIFRAFFGRTRHHDSEIRGRCICDLNRNEGDESTACKKEDKTKKKDKHQNLAVHFLTGYGNDICISLSYQSSFIVVQIRVKNSKSMSSRNISNLSDTRLLVEHHTKLTTVRYHPVCVFSTLKKIWRGTNAVYKFPKNFVHSVIM